MGKLLAEIQDTLHPYNLHFGYRVVNEVAAFIRHANEMVLELKLVDAIDIQILQKILPKFHGTQAKLEEPLGKLLAFCLGEKNIPDESYLQPTVSFDGDARFPRFSRNRENIIICVGFQVTCLKWDLETV
jgi:hypothetical protein